MTKNNAQTNNEQLQKDLEQLKNKSIVKVVVNGMTANKAITLAKNELINVEKSVFNIALLCTYALGTTIPAYVDSKGVSHGEAVCDKPIKKQADLLKLIGRSKATLSKWINAMNLVIEEGRFLEFANGTLPFSYDKIFIIFRNKEAFKDYVLSDLMSMTVDTLEAMTEVETPAEAEAEAEAETPAEAEAETTVISYNGKEYEVEKASFEKWLSKHAKVKEPTNK